MFSQVSVILPTGGADTPRGRQPPWADTPKQTPPGQTPPSKTTTAADGTHPTGMDSCLTLCWELEWEVGNVCISLEVGDFTRLYETLTTASSRYRADSHWTTTSDVTTSQTNVFSDISLRAYSHQAKVGTKAEKLKEPKKTSEKIFAFAFAFAQSKHDFEANSVNKDNGFRIRFTLSVKESPETRTIYFNVFTLLTDDYLRWYCLWVQYACTESCGETTNVSSALNDSTSQRLSVSHRADSNHGTEYIAIFTARKRRLWQGNVFTPVCDSVHRGGCLPHWMLA